MLCSEFFDERAVWGLICDFFRYTSRNTFLSNSKQILRFQQLITHLSVEVWIFMCLSLSPITKYCQLSSHLPGKRVVGPPPFFQFHIINHGGEGFLSYVV